MSTIKAGRDIAPFGVRIPNDLKEKLQNFAEINGRSLNAEILYRLDRSVNEDTASLMIEHKDLFLEIIKLAQEEFQKEQEEKDKK
ncbi:Arc-like DNA binding dprotein [Orbus hercynius]|uniref:Arc-like DNA binding dprotein n=1 Tax=Orbus hercynius TaxID=593135 RepID=A0A495RJJ0_9GAMM|nr:Arc family DNA-binding protein [Orbus hercynius]RKS87336.1 Arc-like DNA binding dprotein [Orbus hercynius]